MSNAVMISIHPYWCEKIASGQKTIEIRKTRPKIETPFKCYIYQTKKKWYCSALRLLGKEDLAEYLEENHGQVIGEFICDEVLSDIIIKRSVDDFSITPQAERALNQSCLNKYAMYEYLSERSGYGLHISNLVIYDEPKELSEFMKHDQCTYFHKNDKSCSFPYRCKKKWLCDSEFLTRPPQSWCYVEGLL